MGMFKGKRGMSPLVATVLLIAFAASLGATIMSFGGLYYEKIREDDVSCSRAFIGAFELKDSEECSDYGHISILNFYDSENKIKNPECYKKIVTGEGSLCPTSDSFFENTWITSKDIIK